MKKKNFIKIKKIEDLETLERMNKLLENSKLTQKDVRELSEQIKASAAKKLGLQ